jgi:hypothetical protein
MHLKSETYAYKGILVPRRAKCEEMDKLQDDKDFDDWEDSREFMEGGFEGGDLN